MTSVSKISMFATPVLMACGFLAAGSSTHAQGAPCGGLDTGPCTINTSSQSIEGTWISQLTDAAGNATLFEVGTYSADGGYSGTNINASLTTHKGVWVRRAPGSDCIGSARY